MGRFLITITYAFSKDGKVRNRMHKLSSKKEQQETDVIENFLEALADSQIDIDIAGYYKLAEADQDFILKTEDGDILLQLTEIVERDYAFPITKSAYNSGKYSQFIHKGNDETPWAIDPHRLETSIKRRIEAKIEKQYAKAESASLWLLVFSTSIYPMTEYCVRGASKASTALITAHAYLRSLDQVIFDQIWYANPMTRPVQLWPCSPGEAVC